MPNHALSGGLGCSFQVLQGLYRCQRVRPLARLYYPDRQLLVWSRLLVLHCSSGFICVVTSVTSGGHCMNIPTNARRITARRVCAFLQQRDVRNCSSTVERVLLVQTPEGRIYAVENKCGHFGIVLDTGRVIGARIQCSQHGAEFDFYSGQVTSHVVAQCDPLSTFVVVLSGDDVCIEL